MAKFTRRQKLSPKEETDLIIKFCQAIASISKTEEAALFVRDLLSKPEVRMLAKRLKIAEMLIKGEKYEDIIEQLKVSASTIARVNVWLNQSGEGYRLVLNRTSRIKEPRKPVWTGLKRKYPMYYWPEILLKEIIYSANKKQKDKLKLLLDKLDEKNELIKELDEMLRKN